MRRSPDCFPESPFQQLFWCCPLCRTYVTTCSTNRVSLQGKIIVQPSLILQECMPVFIAASSFICMAENDGGCEDVAPHRYSGQLLSENDPSKKDNYILHFCCFCFSSVGRMWVFDAQLSWKCLDPNWSQNAWQRQLVTNHKVRKKYNLQPL